MVDVVIDDIVQQCLRELPHGHLDEEIPQHLAVRVQGHLEDCRRCGLEAEAYEQIEQAVQRQGQTVPPESVERLRAFAASLLEQRDDDAGGPR